MSTIRDPFTPDSSEVESGLGLPAMAAAAVFVTGLVVIGLLYMVGEPVSTAPVARESAAPIVTQSKDVSPTPSAPVARESVAPIVTQSKDVSPTPAAPIGKPYLTPDGRSPLPEPGEGIAPPMPAKRLITQEAYEVKPLEMSDLPVPDEPIAWTEAHKHLGQTITVRGTIVDTNNIGQICFLNYDPDWQDKFYIAMFAEAFELLPDPPEQHYLNKTLLVTGKVTLHRDRPQIEVRDVSQIEVVE